MTGHDSIEEQYTSGEFWTDLPDFLAFQAPNKINFLMDFVDFDAIFAELPNKSFTIADIACGAGLVSAGIAERLRKQYPDYDIKVYGYDLSPQAIEVARKSNPDSEFICGNFKDADATWDLALLIDVIEHVPDPDQFIRDAAERARYFVVGFAMDDNLASRLSKKRRQKTHDVGHVSLFNERRAVEVSGRFGDVIRSSYIANPIGRNFRVRRVLHLFTAIPRIVLQLVSQRMKGKIFGGESLFTFSKSSIYSSVS